MNASNRISFKKINAGRLFSYLLVTVWCVFIIVMIAWTVAASLSTSKQIFTNALLQTGFQWDNYFKALKTNPVLLYFGNSLIYTLTSCLIIILISAPCAYILARFSFRGNRFLQAMFTSGIGIPLIMVIMPLFYIASVMHVVGSRWLIVLLYVGLNVPFTVYFLIAFFMNIPTVFEEAAAVDGCPPMRTFWEIIFPLAQPGIITVSIFNFVAIWSEYFIGLIFASKTDIRSISVGLQNMINSMRYSGNWAGMFAVLVIVFIPSIIFYVLLSEKIIAGVTGGAIKG